MSEQDSNLQFVRDMLIKHSDNPDTLLSTYRTIRIGNRPVFDGQQSPIHTHLKLSGLVRREEGRLKVRNRIYEQVFDQDWVAAHWSVNWWDLLTTEVKIAAAAIVILLVALVYTSIYAVSRGNEANEQATLALSRQLAAQPLHISTSREDLKLLLRLTANELASSPDIKGGLRDHLSTISPYLLRHFHGHSSQIRAVAFSPDSEWVAAGGQDGTVGLWNVNAKRSTMISAMKLPSPVVTIEFILDGTVLAAGSDDGSIAFWDIQAKRHLGKFSQSDSLSGSPIRKMAFNNAGTMIAIDDLASFSSLLASSGGPRLGIVLWDLENNRQIGETLIGHKDWVEFLDFNADGTELISINHSEAFHWDVETGQRTKKFTLAQRDRIGETAYNM